MKYLTTAAGLLLTVSTAALLMLTLKAPPSAFGQALKQVRDARTISYNELLTLTGEQQPSRTRVFIAEDGRKRQEAGSGRGDGVTTIFDAAGRIRLTLIEPAKTALVYEEREDQGIKEGTGFRAWLQVLRKLGDKPDRQLGQKELAGKRVTGFVATQGNFTFTMWVDNATGEPVRIDYEPPVKGAGYTAVAMTDFRFNQPLDESLFSFKVPVGYKLQKQAAVPFMPVVTGGETSVLEALRGYTKRTGGKLPASLTDWGPWAVLFSKDSKDGTLDPEATRVLSHLGAITPFLVALPKADYEYLGQGKTVEQKDAIVFWYKKPDGTYRAVYADLSVKDVRAEQLPKK